MLRSPCLLAIACVLTTILGGADAAHADGAFPDSLSILTPAQLPDEIVLATNFGLVTSIDAGQTWTWSCEQEGNSFGIFYQVGAPPLNRLFAVSQGRLVFSSDGACTWNVASGVPAGGSVADAFADPGNPARVLAIVQGAGADGGVAYSVLESTDSGATLGTARYHAAAGAVITGVEIARSQPATIYITLIAGSPAVPSVGRSDDGGTTWHLTDLGAQLGPSTTSLRLIAVDPGDANRVLLRVGGAAGERVGITTDGGATVTTPLQLTGGVVTSYARLASGSIVVGGALGLDPVAYRSTDRGQTFTRLPTPPSLRGLSARGATLYGVADNLNDGYAVGVSGDEGMTWQPLVRYDQIQAIAACLKAACQDDCHARADMQQWPDSMCDATPMPLPVPITADGGAPDAGSDAAAHADAAPDAADAATTPPPAKSGCSCATGDGSPDGRLASALVLALAAIRRRRRARPPCGG